MREYGPGETCCFTGHRANKLPWGYDENDGRCIALKRRLYDVLDGLYETGIRRFICGMALGSDMYFAEAVIALSRKHGDVLLEAAIPCLGQDEHWGEAQRARYNRILSQCGKRTVLSHCYTPHCMDDRNRYMVEHSHVLVAVFGGGTGGTFNTIRMAVRLGLEIVELSV